MGVDYIFNPPDAQVKNEFLGAAAQYFAAYLDRKTSKAKLERLHTLAVTAYIAWRDCT